MTEFNAPGAVAGFSHINGQPAEGAVLTPAPGQTEATITSITGFAWASHQIDYDEAKEISGPRKYSVDQAILAYDLLFFRNHEPDAATPRLGKPIALGSESYIRPDALYAFRRWRRAVGFGEVDDIGRPIRSSSVPGELLAGGATITLPTGAYWMVIAAIHAARYNDTYNTPDQTNQYGQCPPLWRNQLCSNTFEAFKQQEGTTAGLWAMVVNGVVLNDWQHYARDPTDPLNTIPEATLVGLSWIEPITVIGHPLTEATAAGRPQAYSGGASHNAWLILADEIAAFRVNDVRWRSVG